MMDTPGAGTLTIRSAEGVSFAVPLAGPLVRFLAWVIDLAALLVLFLIVNSILAFLRPLSYDLVNGVSIALHFFVVLTYGMFLEWFWRGQTVGKRVMRLRVKDERGLKLRFDQVVLRNLLRVVDMLPLLYLVGGLVCLFSRHNQRLGDIAAGTVVVREPQTRVPDLTQVVGDKYNSFRSHPHLEARLRQLTPPAASTVALEAVMRRDEMDPAQRVSVFAEVAGYFRGLVRFPEEETLGITDEQYVRNALDTIYNVQRAKAKASNENSAPHAG